MYAFREALAEDFEFEAGETRGVHAVPPPPIGPANPSTGTRALSPRSTSEVAAAKSNGSRLVSFVPGPTAPPIGLAESLRGDASATHRPTGDTAPPHVQVARPKASLDGLFSAAVMETLPGFGVMDTLPGCG
jgi:hypothetical protein